LSLNSAVIQLLGSLKKIDKKRFYAMASKDISVDYKAN